MLFCQSVKTKKYVQKNHGCRNDRCFTNAEGQKGTSSAAFLRGSLSLEAAISLPLFLAVLTAVYTFFSVMAFQFRLKLALTETGKKLASYTYAAELLQDDDDGKESVMKELGEWIVWQALSETLVRAMVCEELGKPGVTLLESGFTELSFGGSHIDRESGNLILKAEAKVRIPFLPSPFYFTLSERAVLRTWSSGEVKPDSSGEEDTEPEYVYITEYGKVYHRSPSCSVLALRVYTADRDGIEDRRNLDGSRYYPCEICGPEGRTKVYITDYGVRYHFRADCPNLKRTVRKVPVSEAAGLSPCRICGGG